MKSDHTPHGSSYEASLTPDQRSELHCLLLSGEPLHQLREKTIPWADGPEQGTKPSITTLWTIQSRLRTEQLVCGLEGMMESVEASRKPLSSLAKDRHQEQILDAAITLIGQEVIAKTLEGHGLSTQSAMTRIMLKRADQRRFDRRMRLLEGNSDLGEGE